MLPRAALTAGLVAVILGAAQPDTVAAQAQPPITTLPEGEACDARSATACGRGLWCEPQAGRCRRNAAGTCIRVPQVCTMLYRPVCGCDGRTYGNDCERRSQRVAKKHDGAC
jgi:hypothetical protein